MKKTAAKTDKKDGHRETKKLNRNLSRKEQMVVSRLGTGYTRPTHRHIIEKTPSPECPFCGMSLTTKHILWECKEPRKCYGQMEQND
jgi:hypothetical protein